MNRLEPRLSFLSRLRQSLRRKRVADLRSHRELAPIRQQRMARPFVQGLEPRLVLNATAELTLLGELLVTGTDAAETVQLGVNVNGDLQLRDGADQVILIANHPDDPSSALDPTAITSGNIRFDMRGGDDLLRVALPTNLNINVLASDGADTTVITQVDSPSNAGRSIDIESETITLDPTIRTADFSEASLNWVGDVSVGQSGQVTRIELGSGSLSINGRLILSGDVSLASSSNLDLSSSILTASDSNANLRMLLGDSEVSLGSADDTGGALLGDVVIDSASRVQVGTASPGSVFEIGGDLVVRGTRGDIRWDASIAADSVLIRTDGDLRVGDSITTLGGDVDLFADGDLSIRGDITTVSPDRFGSINLVGGTTALSSISLTTSGGSVSVAGPVAIDGEVRIDSGNQQTSELGGRIQIFDSISASDGAGDVLRLDAGGSLVDGAVRLQGNVGRTDASPGNRDLNSIIVNAGQIETRSIGISNGDLSLSAESIRMLGDQYETRVAGDILITGLLRLPIGDASITSAADLRFSGEVLGQIETGRLHATANHDVVFEGPINDIGELEITAGNLIRLEGPTAIRGPLIASGDTILVRADVDTTSGDIDGDVKLNSISLLSIENNAVVFVGDASIVADGGAGVIHTSASSLQSDSFGQAITLTNANRVSLGNVTATRGTLTIGESRDVTGLINQAGGTRVIVNTLVTSNDAAIDLSGANNDFVSIARVDSGGPVTLNDSVGDVNLVDVRALEQLITVTTNGDMVITAIHAGDDGDVVLIAGDDILDSDMDDDQRIVADAIRLVSENQNAVGDNGIRLSTNVNQLEATVNGPNAGDLVITELDSIELASSDAMTNESVQTSNGQIVVHAGDAITIVDHSVGDDDDARTSDPELVARGSHGRIELIAGSKVELSDDVQLMAEQVTAIFGAPTTQVDPDQPVASTDADQVRAVLIAAPLVVFGDRIQIDTGVGQGIARVFAPRPAVPLAADEIENSFAFFDPTSITVNVLEQALVNDATGILSFDIGQPGEQGLTVDIDWGAPTRRFQQIDGLSADANTFVGVTSTGQPIVPSETAGEGKLTIEHFYAEKSDILDSQLNGRTAATAPLNVRFAVRQHESILVRGDTVIQDGFTNSVVGGGIISSTNQPESEGLDSGIASFIIPSLTIPVAFFPVRDVIPEIETPTFVIRTETSITLTSNTVETTETTTTSIVSREEFFQLRVLSPDPDGEDLVPPKKLPDDILNGDQLQQLFAQLPDGAYEIEYVLGDGDQRSILRVDVRDGEATIPESELDEGELKLRILGDRESLQQKENDELHDESGDRENPDPLPNSARTQSDAAADSATRLEPPSGTALSALVATTTPMIRRRWKRNIDPHGDRLTRSRRFLSRRPE